MARVRESARLDATQALRGAGGASAHGALARGRPGSVESLRGRGGGRLDTGLGSAPRGAL